MRTKSFSAKKLLSLLLTVAMFATMILPASVFAADVTLTNAYVCLKEVEIGVQKPQLRLEFSKDVELAGNWAELMTVDGKDNWMGTGAIQEVVPNEQCIYIDLGADYTFATGDTVVFNGAITPLDAANTLVTTEAIVTKGNFNTVTVKLGTITPADATVTAYKMTSDNPYTLPAQVGYGSVAYKCEREGYKTEYGSVQIYLPAIEAGEATISVSLEKLADFTALKNALAEGEIIIDGGDVEKAKYTTDSYDAFKTAYDAANAINQNTTLEAAQDDVDATVDALKDAITGLTALADFTAFDDAIAAVNALVRANYTTGSLSALDAVVAANTIDKTNEADQAKVNNAANAITTAIANLVETRVVKFTAVAVADNVADIDYMKANKVYLVFDEPIADSANILSKLTINGEAADEYLENASWIDSTIYTMNIKAAMENGAEIKFLGDENIKAVAGHALKEYTTTIVGNLEKVYEEVTATAMTATIVNVDDKPYMVDGDEIVLVFNAPVYGNPATITVDGMTFAVVDDTNNTVYKKILDDDIDTVIAGQKLIFDDGTGRPAITTTLKGTFGGTVVPEVVRALVEDVDGTAKTAGDKINVFFNAPTNKTAGTVENTFVDVLDGATGEWFDNQTLVITLGETPITITDKIDLSNLGIKDFYGTEDAVADEIALEGSFGVAIQPALLTVTAISKEGKGAPSKGDEIYLTFNVKMREDELNLRNDFEFTDGYYGTGATVAWAKDNDLSDGDDYANYSTIIITLGEEANVIPGTTRITINKTLFEETGLKSCVENLLEYRKVTGTFGTSIAPNLISASIVKRSTEVGSQPGDQIVLLFNVPTNAADIINLISVAGGDLGNNVEEGVWSNNNTIYTITLGDGTAIANDTSITFTNTNGVLKDINNQKVASTKTLDLNGSFGVEADEVGISPSSVTATIVKTTAVAGAQAGDQIVFAFNVATNGADLKNYFAAKGIFGSTGLDGGWSNGNTIYTLVLGEGATVTDTNVVEFTVEAGIKDKNEINGAVTLTAGSFIGSFGATITPSSVAPSLLSATIVKGEGNTEGEAQAGDKVVFAFNMATNKADLLANLGSVELFGAGAAGEWNADGNIYTVTLGASATITANTKLTITGSAGLKDKMEYSGVVEIAEIELIGSFGETIAPVAPIPTLKRAYIVKVSEKYGAQAGDQVVLVFNSSTNAVELINSMNDASVFGTGATGAWSNANTVYTITLGTNPTIEEEDTINILSTAGLKDINEISGTQDDSIILEGSFGGGTELHVLSAVAYSSIVEGNYVDFIDIEFNTSVEATIAKEIFTANAPELFGTNYTVARHATMLNVITVKLGNDYSINKNDPERNTIEFSTQEQHVLVSADGMPLVNDANTGNPTVVVTGELRKPMVKEIIAVNEGEFGKIQIVFSSKTNAEAVNLSSQSASLGTNATGTWINNYTLEITLGANRTISVGGGYIVLNGLGITNGFDNNEVVGQYFISKGELPEDELKAVDARVNERADGSYLTVIFNRPTNMDANVTLSGGEKTSAELLGTDATMTWETSTKLVIKLGTNPAIKDGKDRLADAKIAFTGLKYANGLGTVDANPIDITGSFDGRETRLNEFDAKVDGEFTVAKVTLEKQDLDFGKNVEPEGDEEVDNFDAIVTFVIWDKDGKLVTDMNSIKIDVNAVDKIELQSKFATKEAAKVDVYVTDTDISDITAGTPSFEVLADTVTKAVTPASTGTPEGSEN